MGREGDDGYKDHRIVRSKQEKFHGRKGEKTQKAEQKQLIKNSIENAEAKLEKSQLKGERNFKIDATLDRMVAIDQNLDKLPNLLAYTEWIFQVLSDVRVQNFSDEVKEKVVRKASGPGGQNVQKNAAYVVEEHVFTRLRLEGEISRSLEQNRKLITSWLEELVQEHIDEWSDLVDIGKKLGDDMVSVLRMRFGKEITNTWSDSKRQEFARIIGILRNKKNKTPAVN